MINWLRNEPNEAVVDQCRNMAQMSLANAKRRAAVYIYMVVVYTAVGLGKYALAVGCIVAVVEFATRLLDRKIAKVDDPLNRFYVGFYAAVRFLSAMSFLSLGLLSVLSDSISVLLTGLICIIGAMYVTSINNARMPLFYAVSVIPMGLGILLFVILSGHEPYRTSTTLEWCLTILSVLVLHINTHGIIQAYKAAGIELETAKDEAASRLEAMEFIAAHDDLTGLLNRTAFNKFLKTQLLIFEREKKPFGLLLLDLDGFKPINDEFGHPAGDLLLKAVSERLKETAGPKSEVARIGGDEFGIILPDVSDAASFDELTTKLLQAAERPVELGNADVSVGVSIGAAICTPEMNTSELIIAAADEALYQAKQDQKSVAVLFHPSIARKRASLSERRRLQTAITTHQIKPYYQAKFDLKTMKVVGFEALARWPGGPGNAAHSAQFIEDIEEMGLLGDFTYHMAKQVFADLELLLKDGFDPGQVSLNLSEVTLATSSGLEDLLWIISENQSVVPHITLEITEDVFITRAGARIRESIQQLRGLGVQISLDDFGTGFASFQHLRQLEFDELKIDTEFVQGLGVDPAANVIVDGFLSIARGLGVRIVAEGVETDAQRKYLCERGCSVGQGFLHSKAQPLDQIRSYLAPEKETITDMRMVAGA